MTEIRNWQKEIHAWAVRKEWRGPKAETQRTTGDDIALMVSEASEALEAFREKADPTAYWETYTVYIKGTKFKNLSADQLLALGYTTREIEELEGKPEGVGPELADLVIRVMDYCEHVGIDLSFEIDRKMAHNENREIRHGGMHL